MERVYELFERIVVVSLVPTFPEVRLLTVLLGRTEVDPSLEVTTRPAVVFLFV